MPDMTKADLDLVLVAPFDDGKADNAVANYNDLRTEATESSVQKRARVRNFVADHPNTCSDVSAFLADISVDHQTRIHNMIGRDTVHVNFLLEVASWDASFRSTLERVVGSNLSDERCLAAVAAHTNASAGVLGLAIKHINASAQVLALASRHANVTSAELGLIASKPIADRRVLEAVLANHKTDERCLYAVVAHDNASVEVLTAAIINPNVSAQVLTLAAHHDNATPELLRQIASSDLADKATLEAVLDNPRADGTVLSEIIKNPNADLDVLIAVAQKTSSLDDITEIGRTRFAEDLLEHLEVAARRIEPTGFSCVGRDEARAILGASTRMAPNVQASLLSASLHAGRSSLTEGEIAAVKEGGELVVSAVQSIRYKAKDY